MDTKGKPRNTKFNLFVSFPRPQGAFVNFVVGFFALVP